MIKIPYHDIVVRLCQRRVWGGGTGVIWDIRFIDMKMGFVVVIFSSTFLMNCGRSESLRIVTCLKTVVGGKQGHAPCKMLFVSVECFEDHRTVRMLR